MSEDATKTDRLARIAFILAILLSTFACGVAFARYEVFPYEWIDLAADELRSVFRGEKLARWYVEDPDSDGQIVHAYGDVGSGANLVIQMGAEGVLTAKIIDMRGQELHNWDLDWFRVWPDADHLSEEIVPKERPGTHVHGAVVMPNGDLVFNYEHLGLVRLDRAGDVVWRLPYQTHHSLHVHDDGNLWVCGKIYHTKPSSRFPARTPPFSEYTILEVSPEGAILHEWSLQDLLRTNGFAGLICQSPRQRRDGTEDNFHLNDVEPFPDSMAEGFFKRGDVLLSLRDNSAVLVFNRFTEKITHASIGRFAWQHDPDFIDGNSYSVFDNHPDPLDERSRIVIVTAPAGTVEVHYQGTEAQPFYTPNMGKHQRLDNGHMLISETRNGRAFEIDGAGKVVWEYFNYVSPNVRGMVEEAQRLPPAIARMFRDPPK